MTNFTLITALILCSFSWTSASVSESQTVIAQRGEEVTLQCSNMSSYPSLTFWFRLVNRNNASCISTMANSKDVEYCEGFKYRSEMSTNIKTVFLKIRYVDLADTGLYFCGFWIARRLLFSVVHLNVEEDRDEPHDDMDNECQNESDGTANLTSVILGSLTIFLVNVIIGLIVKVRKLQTALSEEKNSQQYENVDSDELKVTALRMYSATKRSRRPESEKEEKTHVIYTASK